MQLQKQLEIMAVMFKPSIVPKLSPPVYSVRAWYSYVEDGGKLSFEAWKERQAV